MSYTASNVIYYGNVQQIMQLSVPAYHRQEMERLNGLEIHQLSKESNLRGLDSLTTRL